MTTTNIIRIATPKTVEQPVAALLQQEVEPRTPRAIRIVPAGVPYLRSLKWHTTSALSTRKHPNGCHVVSAGEVADNGASRRHAMRIVDTVSARSTARTLGASAA
jgi:hypothetical protein